MRRHDATFCAHVTISGDYCQICCEISDGTVTEYHNQPEIVLESPNRLKRFSNRL